MAEQLATENSVQQIADNIKKGNETQTSDTKESTEETKKLGGIVSKASDLSQKMSDKALKLT